LSKILVTGGAGFIGSYLVDRLVSQSNEVIVFDNEFRGMFSNLGNDQFIKVKGNILDQNSWNELPKGIDTVFHLAAINGTKFFYEIPEQVLEINVKGILNALDFVIKNDISDVFFASSSEVYGFPKNFPTSEEEDLKIPDPLNPRFSYAGSKIIGELLCINYARKYGFKNSIARFHNIYGPKMGHEHVIPEFIRKIVKKESFTIHGDGTETRSFCFIEDAIDAILLIQKNDSVKERIFNVGNPEEVSIIKLIDTLSEISGTKIEPICKPMELAGTKRRVPDITKLKSIGYNPKTMLNDGLKTTFDWYMDYYSKN